MELKKLLEKRQSIRHFTDADVKNADLLEILDAARLAPSGKNLQNWHFIVVKNKALMDKVAACIAEKSEAIATRLDERDKESGKGDRFRKVVKKFTLFFLKAPVLIIVMTETYYSTGYHELVMTGADPAALESLLELRNPGMQSLGAAVENLTLRAIDLGYGSCWLTSANYAAEGIEDLLRSEAGFDRDGWYMAALLALGVPKPDAKSPGKKPLAEIYTLIE